MLRPRPGRLPHRAHRVEGLSRSGRIRPGEPVGLADVARARRDPALCVLEGFHACKHALRFGGELLGAWTADRAALGELGARLAPDVALQAEEVAEDALASVVPRAQVVAIARRPAQPPAAELLASPDPRPLVLLEDPRHLGNVGACIRVAAAAGAAGVLCTGRADPWHPDALRGSAGLHFALPVLRVYDHAPGDRPLVALDPDGAPLGGPTTLPPRAVLAFGTERDGLSEALLADAALRLALPMEPGVSSMNLATAVAATLYVSRLA